MNATGLKVGAKRSVICAALAVAGVVSAPAAHADSYTTLLAYNIEITLADARPNDGLAPSITFASGSTIPDFAAFWVGYDAHTSGTTGAWTDSLAINDIFTLGAGTVATFSVTYDLGAYATLPDETASTTLTLRAVGEGSVAGTTQDRSDARTAAASFASGVAGINTGVATITYYNLSTGNRTAELTGTVEMSGFGAPMSPVVAIPEPGTYAMFLAGLAAMGAVARRRTAKSKTASAA
ncbi:PEP-CTERM sorting domain-containing protein [Ideonella sp.]|uniref:PEP-CTERM sorting domain-containing protein n=1 Tax=Ideonella sp. TaxID=1929293 RepID=UPI003BB6F74C